jgi:hypothetical protein
MRALIELSETLTLAHMQPTLGVDMTLPSTSQYLPTRNTMLAISSPRLIALHQPILANNRHTWLGWRTYAVR